MVDQVQILFMILFHFLQNDAMPLLSSFLIAFKSSKIVKSREIL